LSLVLARGPQFQAPKRLSKPLEGIVGAAPLSRPGALPVSFCGSAFASCFDGEGLVAAFAVLVSAGGGSDFGRDAPAALCPRLAAEAAGFDLDVCASAGWGPRRVPALGAGRLCDKAAAPPPTPRPPRAALH